MKYLSFTEFTTVFAALEKAKDFYERALEVEGGCDHGAGYCSCGDRADYTELAAIIEELRIKLL